MLFLAEVYTKNRQAKIRAWEKARQKWIDEDKFGYRDRHDWAVKHPYPVIKWGNVFSFVLPIVVTLALVAGATLAATHHHPNTTKSHPTVVSQKKPGDFKVGDKVQVVYGDFKDSTGVLIKVGDSGYIIKLTNSTYTIAMANAQDRTGGQDNGTLLSVDDSDNLVPYKDVI